MSPLDWLTALFALLQMDVTLLAAMPRGHALFHIGQLASIFRIPQVPTDGSDGYTRERREALNLVAMHACRLYRVLTTALPEADYAPAIWHQVRLVIDGRLVAKPTTALGRRYDPKIEAAIAAGRPERAARLMRRMYGLQHALPWKVIIVAAVTVLAAAALSAAK